MQEVIDKSVEELVEIIESKKNSSAVAWQFILEEHDAAKNGIPFVRDRLDTFYIGAAESVGAMDRSWDDVDGPSGPQQFLNSIANGIAHSTNVEVAAMVRITIVEYIIKHYGFGRYYLDRNIRQATKPLDLFNLTTTEEKLHPHFKYLLKNEEMKEVLQRWSSGFEDRDNKFCHEFQTTFNSSFWEIYLNQCFSDLGMNIDFSKASPDFNVVTKNGNNMCIEAAIANHANNSASEWSGEKIKENDLFLNTSCVRLFSAIASKHKKYIDSYSKLDHVKEKPFIIALAPFEQPLFFNQNNEAIIRILYGQGVAIEQGPNIVLVPTIKKNDSVSLDLEIFTNENYKEISAIIFSTTATIGKVVTQTSLINEIRFSRFDSRRGLVAGLTKNADHFETHLDGLQIHYNPFARYPIDEIDFNRYEITDYHYDINKDRIDNRQNNYTLISRNVL